MTIPEELKERRNDDIDTTEFNKSAHPLDIEEFRSQPKADNSPDTDTLHNITKLVPIFIELSKLKFINNTELKEKLNLFRKTWSKATLPLTIYSHYSENPERDLEKVVISGTLNWMANKVMFFALAKICPQVVLPIRIVLALDVDLEKVYSSYNKLTQEEYKFFFQPVFGEPRSLDPKTAIAIQKGIRGYHFWIKDRCIEITDTKALEDPLKVINIINKTLELGVDNPITTSSLLAGKFQDQKTNDSVNESAKILKELIDQTLISPKEMPQPGITTTRSDNILLDGKSNVNVKEFSPNSIPLIQTPYTNFSPNPDQYVSKNLENKENPKNVENNKFVAGDLNKQGNTNSKECKESINFKGNWPAFTDVIGQPIKQHWDTKVNIDPDGTFFSIGNYYGINSNNPSINTIFYINDLTACQDGINKMLDKVDKKLTNFFAYIFGKKIIGPQTVNIHGKEFVITLKAAGAYDGRVSGKTDKATGKKLYPFCLKIITKKADGTDGKIDKQIIYLPYWDCTKHQEEIRQFISETLIKKAAPLIIQDLKNIDQQLEFYNTQEQFSEGNIENIEKQLQRLKTFDSIPAIKEKRIFIENQLKLQCAKNTETSLVNMLKSMSKEDLTLFYHLQTSLFKDKLSSTPKFDKVTINDNGAIVPCEIKGLLDNINGKSLNEIKQDDLVKLDKKIDEYISVEIDKNAAIMLDKSINPHIATNETAKIAKNVFSLQTLKTEISTLQSQKTFQGKVNEIKNPIGLISMLEISKGDTAKTEIILTRIQALLQSHFETGELGELYYAIDVFTKLSNDFPDVKKIISPYENNANASHEAIEFSKSIPQYSIVELFSHADTPLKKIVLRPHLINDLIKAIDECNFDKAENILNLWSENDPIQQDQIINLKLKIEFVRNNIDKGIEFWLEQFKHIPKPNTNELLEEGNSNISYIMTSNILSKQVNQLVKNGFFGKAAELMKEVYEKDPDIWQAKHIEKMEFHHYGQLFNVFIQLLEGTLTRLAINYSSKNIKDAVQKFFNILNEIKIFVPNILPLVAQWFYCKYIIGKTELFWENAEEVKNSILTILTTPRSLEGALLYAQFALLLLNYAGRFYVLDPRHLQIFDKTQFEVLKWGNRIISGGYTTLSFLKLYDKGFTYANVPSDISALVKFGFNFTTWLGHRYAALTGRQSENSNWYHNENLIKSLIENIGILFFMRRITNNSNSLIFTTGAAVASIALIYEYFFSKRNSATQALVAALDNINYWVNKKTINSDNNIETSLTNISNILKESFSGLPYNSNDNDIVNISRVTHFYYCVCSLDLKQLLKETEIYSENNPPLISSTYQMPAYMVWNIIVRRLAKICEQDILKFHDDYQKYSNYIYCSAPEAWRKRHIDEMIQSFNELLKFALEQYVIQASLQQDNELKKLYLSNIRVNYNYAREWSELLGPELKFQAAYLYHTMGAKEDTKIFLERISEIEIKNLLKNQKNFNTTIIALNMLEDINEDLWRHILLNRVDFGVDDEHITNELLRKIANKKYDDVLKLLEEDGVQFAGQAAIHALTIFEKSNGLALFKTLEILDCNAIRKNAKDRTLEYWKLLYKLSSIFENAFSHEKHNRNKKRSHDDAVNFFKRLKNLCIDRILTFANIPTDTQNGLLGISMSLNLIATIKNYISDNCYLYKTDNGETKSFFPIGITSIEKKNLRIFRVNELGNLAIVSDNQNDPNFETIDVLQVTENNKSIYIRLLLNELPIREINTSKVFGFVRNHWFQFPPSNDENKSVELSVGSLNRHGKS